MAINWEGRDLHSYLFLCLICKVMDDTWRCDCDHVNKLCSNYVCKSSYEHIIVGSVFSTLGGHLRTAIYISRYLSSFESRIGLKPLLSLWGMKWLWMTSKCKNIIYVIVICFRLLHGDCLSGFLLSHAWSFTSIIMPVLDFRIMGSERFCY